MSCICAGFHYVQRYFRFAEMRTFHFGEMVSRGNIYICLFPILFHEMSKMQRRNAPRGTAPNSWFRNLPNMDLPCMQICERNETKLSFPPNRFHCIFKNSAFLFQRVSHSDCGFVHSYNFPQINRSSNNNIIRRDSVYGFL